GSITIASDGSYTYTPALNFNGIDTVDYTVTDGALTDVGTLTITVNAVNDNPVANADAYATNEDTTLTINLPNDVLANDSDIDGDSLTVNTAPVTDVANGTLTLNADGTFTYVPNANFNGTDSFVYEASDGNGGTAQATVTITVNAVNDAPVAIDDAASTSEDTVLNSVVDLDNNDLDVDGDALTVVAGTFATTQGGSITIASDGSYTYTPALNFTGDDTVDYTVTDGTLTDVGTLTITVGGVNDAPVAVDDTITATEDTVFNSTIDLDANDTDLDGDALTVVAGTFATTQGGSITI
ncbi:tandem-95 repeat protein, partial [Aurantivibrio infirmus]